MSNNGNINLNNTSANLNFEKICSIIQEGTPKNLVENKRVLVLTPDSTRTAPLPVMIKAIKSTVGSYTAKLDFMIALGTHPIMSKKAIYELFGISEKEKQNEFADNKFLNHRWDLPETLVKIGSFEKNEIETLTNGLFSERIDVTINREIFAYDLLIILGPIFPHEIVGFSGGHKYLFPGISGGEFLDFFHWLSAVIGCSNTIGRKETPARSVVEKAAEMVSVPRHLIAMVVTSASGLENLYAGEPKETWAKAVAHSSKIHIVKKERPYKTVLGCAPHMYDEMWVAGKVMYKLEPIVADGGTLIIYGPHINKISQTWGNYIKEIGYHVAEYFLVDIDSYQHIPRGVLAHSAVVKGAGTFNKNIEKPRINVVLATGLSKQTCEEINLGYMNPLKLDVNSFKNRETEGILCVEHAGEVLHLLNDK